MMKPLFSHTLGTAFGSALLLAASAAAAQPAPANPNCPPGSWFCADAPPPSAAPAGQPVAPQQLQPLPPPQVPAPGAPPVQPQPAPPVIVYQAPPPVIVVRPAHPEAPPPVYVYTPRENPRSSEWGLALRLEGAMLGSRNTGNNAHMGGLGFGLRFKPIPELGIQADLDFFGGRDYNDFRRTETAFTVNGLIFVNPKSKAQVYFLAGLGWSGARAIDDTSGYDRATYDYGYFGGQAGVGLEWRIGKHFALNGDLRGFVRGRVDKNAHSAPEFVDAATGKSTNTSGGGLITGGMTFYF
jgi:hypothetical protein